MAPMLGVLDYIVFSAMLIISAIIGAFYAFFSKHKQNTTAEYLMGGRSMGVFPVSMSLISSFISGITLLGMPAEMYVYGTQFWTVLIPITLASIATGVFFVPVFYQLNLTSSYEYLSLRFNSKVRLLGSFLYIINNLLFIPIVIYIPGLAFSQVSGVNPHLVTPFVCLICIFYTSVGGLKAVVWTDTLQTILMFGSMIVIVILGTLSAGGASNVWNLSEAGERIEFFNFDPDPTVRHTFWTITVGSFFLWLVDISANQGMIQRFMSMPTLRKSQLCVGIFCLGAIVIVSVSCYSGLVIYATYHDCDLLTTNIVKRNDQLLPYLVMDIAKGIPGLPGLFMAGVFSAALSSMSTGLNSMSGVIYKDFIQNWFNYNPSEERASFIMKILCVIIGILCTAMVLIIEKLGPVVQVTGSLLAVALGPLLGLFVLGMFLPWSNSKGALSGGVFGLILMAFIVFRAQEGIASGKVKAIVKPVSYEGCTDNVTIPTTLSPLDDPIITVTSLDIIMDGETAVPLKTPKTNIIFRISYRYYGMIGFLATACVGMAVSCCTGLTSPLDVDPILITPPLQRFLYPRECKGTRQSGKGRFDNHMDDGATLPLQMNTT